MRTKFLKPSTFLGFLSTVFMLLVAVKTHADVLTISDWYEISSNVENTSVASGIQLGFSIVASETAMPVAESSSFVVPNVRSGNAHVSISRGFSMMPLPPLVINSGNNTNVRIYIEGELVLHDTFDANRLTIWNVDFVIRDGGVLVLGRNNHIQGYITLYDNGSFIVQDHGARSGTYANSPTPPAAQPQAALQILPANISIPDALEVYCANSHYSIVEIRNVGNMHSGIIDYNIYGDFTVQGFELASLGINADSSAFIAITPNDDLPVGSHIGTLTIFYGDNSEVGSSISFDVLSYDGFFGMFNVYIGDDELGNPYLFGDPVEIYAENKIGYEFYRWNFDFYITTVDGKRVQVERELEFLALVADTPVTNAHHQHVSFAMPNAHVVATPIWVESQEPTQHRIFIDVYVYGSFSRYATPIVYVLNQQQEVFYDEGRPFVALQQGENFLLRIDVPNHYSFYQWHDLPYQDPYFTATMGFGDVVFSADFVRYYTVIVDEAPTQAFGGQQFFINAQNRSGYNFYRWNIIFGDIIIAQPQNQSTYFVVAQGFHAGQVVAEVASIWTSHSQNFTVVIYNGGLGHYYLGTTEPNEVIQIFAGTREGYHFTEWLINGEHLSNDSRASFVMPSRNVVLTAIWTRDTISPPPDLGNDDEQTEVATPQGTSQNQVPNLITPTIPNFDAILLPPPTYISLATPSISSFFTMPVVNPTQWHEIYSANIVANGVMQMVSENDFAPESPMTNHMLAYILNVIGIDAELNLDEFSIVSRQNIANIVHAHLLSLEFEMPESPLDAMHYLGIFIVQGIDPHRTITRSETAAVLTRMLYLIR